MLGNKRRKERKKSNPYQNGRNKKKSQKDPKK